MVPALLLLPLLLAYGEQIPDYNNPYAPILLDKPQYTWTDKVVITIIAPSWNTNNNLVDSIGGAGDHPIDISTRGHSLESYRLAETTRSSGVFRGEVTLTGFAHDADGDRDIDTTPRTAGSGPTGGFLEADRDTAVTVTFEFADGVIISESVPISWNIGTVELSAPFGSPASVRVSDPDMNLNPDALDGVDVIITTDSDSVGITLRATETSESSGVFAADFEISDTATPAGNRIHAPQNSQITARYDDHTLPEPHSESDSARIEATARTGPAVQPTERLGQSAITFTNGVGEELQSVSAGMQVQMVATVSNNQQAEQGFVHIFQVRDSAGRVAQISWVVGELGASSDARTSQSWTPSSPGEYRVESFVWRSLADPEALAPASSASVAVE